MLTRVFKTYELYELPQDAQKRAYEVWKNEVGYCNMEEAQRTLREFCNHFNVSIYALEYLSEDRPYVQFKVMSPELRIASGTGLVNYLFEYHGGLLFNKDGLRIPSPLSGFFMDYLMLEPLYNYLQNPDDRDYELLMDECLDIWAVTCAKDFKECTSFEYFMKECNMRNWRFLENGRMF